MREALKKYLQENESSLIAIAKLEASMTAAASIVKGKNTFLDRQPNPDFSTDNPVTKQTIAALRKSQVRILLTFS